MSDEQQSGHGAGNPFAELLRHQGEAVSALFGQNRPDSETSGSAEEEPFQWADLARRLQSMWAADFQPGTPKENGEPPLHYSDAFKWLATAESVAAHLPLADPQTQARLWGEGFKLFETVMSRYGISQNGEDAGEPPPELPRSDRRFADPAWRDQPFFALLHQTYLMLEERLTELAQDAQGLEPAKKAQLVFATKALADALSPANFVLTNPVALAKARETKGESLIAGMEHLIADIKRGQITHTDPEAFTLGKNIATTPGKVVYESRLFQLIQYTPTTKKVLETPLVIFPPWINRFYILDLNEKKSFVRWAVEQGLSVFMVSWKSADASMADVVWDDYIAAQVEAIDTIRNRLNVPSVHAIGYCVAGTTLAATLAMLARRGEADKVKSATFFTAQVDFSEAGDLKHFIDDQQLEMIGRVATDGYIDGRYLAATFNMLRGNDLIWSYVEKNYLKGEDYPAFDLLHWNSDSTNLPAHWHRDYLRDLYRDNRLAIPDSMTACGTPIDLRRIETPCLIQAGREDHIAPPESVWKMTKHLKGDWTFLLAGSGHIAGVVNPPAAGKYQYWTNPGHSETLEDFIAGAEVHPGSWWPYWFEWLRAQGDEKVSATGKRKPGGRNDTIIEDAPGRYVMTR